MRIHEMIKKNNIKILFFLTLISMTVGFAVYNQQLNIGGNVSLVPGGVIAITNVQTVSLSDTAEANPEYDETSIDFNLFFTTKQNGTYEAVFDITISNESFDDFVFSMPDYKLQVGVVTDAGTVLNEEYSAYAGYKISNINIGDKIPAKTEKTFRITFTFSNPQEEAAKYEISGDFVPSVSKDTEATLRASVSNSGVADLTGENEKAKCTIDVISSFSADKTFTITTRNTSKFVIYEPDKTYTIPANGEETFEFYLARVEGAEYPYTSTWVDIAIESQGVTYPASNITVIVDKNIDVKDTTPPTVRNVTATIGDEENTAQLSWDGEDDVNIANFTIYIYQKDTETNTYTKLDKDVTVLGNERDATITDLAEGTYCFTIFATDDSGNTATQDEITNATASAGTAVKTADVVLDWNFNVTINTTNNVTYTGNVGENVVKRGETYNATLTIADGMTDYYKIPENLENDITMGGTVITNFTYDNTTGAISIPAVTGDIIINAEGISKFEICLLEGTKILLADGSYKNIEDIEYTDLLAVYDHLNGGITHVYPVWIEEEGKTSSYEKITFDDGSFIKVAGHHCLFDSELSKYVDVSNSEEFGIGSKVYKVENDSLKIVTATKIEYINEEVKFYDILSTTHYNIIANDFITTDGITQLSNVLYGFKENAVFANWDKVISSEKIEYKDATFFPYHIFKGCNFNNTLFLKENNYLDLEKLARFLEYTGKKQISKNGEKYFMVTTSADQMNSKDYYLYKEGTKYVFPQIGAKYFVDTATNEKYKEGEIFTVFNSTHFKVIY